MNASHRLWQLISPALPVGAYSYSQGLEYAIEAQWVSDESSAYAWIQGIAQSVLGQQDLPVLARMFAAWRDDDELSVMRWNAELLAFRESRELLDEDLAMGAALRRLATGLELPVPAVAAESSRLSYAAVFSWLCREWRVDLRETLGGFLWSWMENQVTASIKLVPLGQTAGQRMLLRLGDSISDIVEQALSVADEDIGLTAPGLGIASGLHETQFTRLFRS